MSAHVRTVEHVLAMKQRLLANQSAVGKWFLRKALVILQPKAR
jgi:hypothetical protein